MTQEQKDKLFKALCFYLPYRVMMQFQNDSGFPIVELGFMDKYKFFSDKKYNWLPILHPLSDLTKEIEHNGERFVPIERIRKDIGNVSMYQYTNGDFEFNIESEYHSQEIDLWDGFRIAEKLLEWHFDIFGLIEEGLAVDINKIEK